MRPRQDIVELFSTLLQLDGDRDRRWLTDAHLRRSMQACLRQSDLGQGKPEAVSSEHFWALYWHKVWQNQRSKLARGHLSAYIQEPCYWAAQKTTLSFASLQYTLADCFQMAIAHLDKVLNGFDADHGCTLKSYASATLNSLIRECLRQQQEVDICTDWALLRKLSQKRFVEALKNTGLSEQTIASYVLAWTSFKAAYVPTQATGTRKLPRPDAATWAQMVQLYNRDRLTHLSTAAPSATSEMLERWLLACAKAARAYLYPTSVSINTPKDGDDSSEFLDSLPDTAQQSVLSELIVQEEAHERQIQQRQVNAILLQTLAQLPTELTTILEMYYARGLTQQQMATQLNTKQYTVSRRLTKARETLLLAFAQWSRDTLHITPTSDVLKHTSVALEDWLQTHYRHPERSSLESDLVEQPL